MAATTSIEWKQAKRNKSSNQWWESRCGWYAVHESRFCEGVEFQAVEFAAWEKYRARDRGGFVMVWRVLSRHRTRGEAERACQKAAKVRATVR